MSQRAPAHRASRSDQAESEQQVCTMTGERKQSFGGLLGCLNIRLTVGV